MNTTIKNTISGTDSNAKYDECAKQLLAQKYILANILVKTIKAVSYTHLTLPTRTVV